MSAQIVSPALQNGPGASARVVAPVVTLGALALVVAGAAVGLPPAALVALAALPLLATVGYRLAFPLLVGALFVRVLTDGGDVRAVNVALAAFIVVLGAMVLWRAPGWTAPVLGVTALLFVSAFAGAATYGAAITFGEAVRVTSCIAVLVVAANSPTHLSVRRVAHCVQVVGLLPALSALYQYATGTGDMLNETERSTGTLAHANSAAMLFALCNLVTFALLLDGRGKRWPSIVLTAVFLGAQLSTGSIGGLVACLVMLLVYLFTRAVRRADRVILAVGGIALAVFAAINSPVGAERIAEFQDATVAHPNSFAWRIQAWSDVLDAWRRHPVFGNGLGASLAHTFVPGFVPHNEYVRLLAEVGVVGLGVVLIAGVVFARAMARRGKRSASPEAASLALAALAGTAANALAANTMLYSVSFYTTLFILGACWRITRDGGLDVRNAAYDDGSLASVQVDAVAGPAPKI